MFERTHRLPKALILAPLLATPTGAQAHLVGVEFGDFYAGALHLTLDPGQIATLVILGVIAGLNPRPKARWMLAALPAGLCAGAGLGAVWGTPVTEQIAVPVLLALTGIIGVIARELPLAALAALAAVVGLVLGTMNGAAANAFPIDLLLYTAGVATAGTMLGTFMIAIGSRFATSAPWVSIGYRAVSSWAIAVGLISLGLSASA